MGTEKRERQKAARQAKVEAETVQEKRSRQIRTAVRAAVIIGLAVVAAFAYSVIWGGDDDNDVEAGSEDTPEDDSPEPEEEASGPTTTIADPGEPIEPECPAEDGSSPRQLSFSGPPPMCIDPEATYVAQVQTTRGDFEITLDAELAPQTVNNFVFLARWHYYEGVGFHRVIPGFMAQTGDPVGEPPGTGGPGYEMGDIDGFDGEVPTEEPAYPEMSVAMANSGGPETNGSQFFVVTDPETDHLGTDYTRFGLVTAGEDIVNEIEATGEDTDGETPKDLTVIEQITITEQ